jgi:catechol 2,3-dioxygenase-like lactoylglutathione lyase family enzyme
MTAPNINGTHHIAVQVRDLVAAEAFYAGVLGLQVLKRWPLETGGDRSLWLDLGGGSFLALERASAAATPPSTQEFQDGHAGWHLVALRISVGQRTAWEEHLARHDVSIVHRSRWTLYVRDPDGNRIGLSHHPEDA